MSVPEVLFLDDEAMHPHHEWERCLVAPLARAGIGVIREPDARALAAYLKRGVAAVLLDLAFGNDPGMGLRLLGEIKSARPDCPVIVLTASTGISVDLRCHASGADGYHSKAALDAELLGEMLNLLIHQVPGRQMLLGSSDHARALRRSVRLARGCDSTVLITGETGTGKELVARGIHLLGPRWSAGARFGNFVPVNCAGIPDDLWESEMFGHRRGAATGLASSHAGCFLSAAGFAVGGEPRRDSDPVPLRATGSPGTLFLDEVGELPMAMQGKLLRSLQERRLRLVGDPREYPLHDRLDVRVIAATNRNLREEMAGGRFRTDLFYRVNVLRIQVPPLRERKEDISELLAAFLKEHVARGLNVQDVEPDAITALESHRWTGNVRELENVVERAAVRLRLEGGSVLRATHLEVEVDASSPAPDRLALQMAEAILSGDVEPEAINPRPASGRVTFGPRVYRQVADILRARSELSQRRLAEVWHLEPGSIGPLNTACGVNLRRGPA